MIARLIAAFCIAFLACTAPAQAQITAVYKNRADAPVPFEMKIEITPNGDLRGSFPGMTAEVMTVDGEGYMISGTGKDAKVVRVSDLVAILSNILHKQHPELAARMREGVPAETAPALVKGGIVTVNGRQGAGWYFNEGDNIPVIVISTDPVLAPLGKAMAAQFEISISMMKGMMGEAPAFMTQTLEILQSGAPLSYAGMELATVETGAIPPERFVLPAAPLTREEATREVEARGGRFP